LRHDVDTGFLIGWLGGWRHVTTTRRSYWTRLQNLPQTVLHFRVDRDAT